MNKAKPATPPTGSYVNFLRVIHAPSEVCLDFGQLAPGQTQAARLVSSLVTTPFHAKAMMKALAASIERYEKQFGEIPTSQPQPQRVEKGPADESEAAAEPA